MWNEPALPAKTVPAGQVPDLADEAVRAELSQVAIDAFVRIVEIWRLTGRQAADLLAKPIEADWFAFKAERSQVLSQDVLTRISGLVGLYKGLHLLFSDPLADEWVRRANDEPPFGGKPPITVMIEGGIEMILETRNHIDALRGGL